MDAGLNGRRKRAVDVAMTAVLLFLMGYQFWGDAAHEWAGAGIFVLFAVHHILNWRWHKNLFQGKYSPMRIFQVCIDILTLFSMIALIYSSIVLSTNHEGLSQPIMKIGGGWLHYCFSFLF